MDSTLAFCNSCGGCEHAIHMPVLDGEYYCKDCYPKMKTANQLSFNDCFKEQSKTKKLSVKDGVLIEDAFKHALVFINTQTEYNRIEFKFGANYIVIAKLKEESK